VFCIAAFVILLVLGAVSAKYRRLLGQAWRCVGRRVTFRACDSSFKQDTKDRLLAPLAARSPGLVKPVSAAIEVLAVMVVLTTVWSGYEVVTSGLNLWVYGTCNKEDSASCSLGAEACSVSDATPGFLDSLGNGDVLGAFGRELGSVGETISAIPARLRTWDAADFADDDATYLRPFDATEPTAIELVDPGCQYCKKLFENIEESGFADRYNLTYIAYPIRSGDGYKFPNSLLVAQYLEALRQQPLEDAATPVDWQILEHLYAGENADGVSFQLELNWSDHEEAVDLLHGWLREAGMTAEQIDAVDVAAGSAAVAAAIERHAELVEDEVHTLKIPTIIFDGRRHDGVVDVDGLR
jgi:hypothetical protein